MDPFGHSAMMPYLFSLAGINRMVINRISTLIKDIMKQKSQLHFRWVQPWDEVIAPLLLYTAIRQSLLNILVMLAICGLAGLILLSMIIRFL